MSTASKALNQVRHLANLNEREALGWADAPALRNRALGACSAYRNCASYLERVIADDAAPELLGALEALLGYLEGTGVDLNDNGAECRAAIAKARGEVGR
jgi:hypothetical protein